MGKSWTLLGLCHLGRKYWTGSNTLESGTARDRQDNAYLHGASLAQPEGERRFLSEQRIKERPVLSVCHSRFLRGNTGKEGAGLVSFFLFSFFFFFFGHIRGMQKFPG